MGQFVKFILAGGLAFSVQAFADRTVYVVTSAGDQAVVLTTINIELDLPVHGVVQLYSAASGTKPFCELEANTFMDADAVRHEINRVSGGGDAVGRVYCLGGYAQIKYAGTER